MANCVYKNYCDHMRPVGGVDWEHAHGHCYMFFNLAYNYASAKAKCAGYGGVIATARSGTLRVCLDIQKIC